MAKNGASGTARVATVPGRRQVKDPKTGLWTHRDTSTGRFVAVKAAGGSFAGVIREDGAWHRRPGGRLVRADGMGRTAKRVGWRRWLLRWGGR